jgi:uncharacterized protein
MLFTAPPTLLQEVVMNVFITGGTGFVGRYLVETLNKKGHHTTVVGRRKDSGFRDDAKIVYISANTTQPGPWQNPLKDCTAVFNLAGQSIFGRWNRRYKKQMYDSRVLTTRNIVAALPTNRQATLISASAAGYYGHRGNDILVETESPGADFLAGICIDWEKEAQKARKKGWRVATTRLGVVLGSGGGVLEKIVPAYRLFLGGNIGDGSQWFPWIHMDDLLAAFLYIWQNEDLDGAFNLCAPLPVQYKKLAKALGTVLKRPSILPTPGFMMRMALGEFGETMLNSHRMQPDRLEKHGFRFNYPEIDSALRHLLAMDQTGS